MSRHSDTSGGVDLTIYSTHSAGFSPGRTFVNGQEVFVPSGSQIELSDLTDGEAATVTMTMFVRSLQLLPNLLLEDLYGESDE